jgi:hypothetical protein
MRRRRVRLMGTPSRLFCEMRATKCSVMQRDAFEDERTLRREKTTTSQEMWYCFAPLRFRTDRRRE